MSIPIPTSISDVKEIAENVDKFGKNDRTLFISVVAGFLFVLVIIIIWLTTAEKEQRESFLQHIREQNVRNNQSMDKMSDALDRNSQTMYELNATLKK